MNKVIIIGRLTKNPDTRRSETGAVTHFTVAVDRKYQKAGEQTADYPNCVAFGKTAEFIEKYFVKGSKIVVDGRIQTGSYTNKDGLKVYTTDIVCESVEFGESKKAEPPASNSEWIQIPEGIENDLPFK